MNEEVFARLRRLGVVKGVRNIQPSRPTRSSAAGRERASSAAVRASGEPQSLVTLLPGLRLSPSVSGACYILDKVYPLEQRHGSTPLNDLLELSPTAAALFCDEPRLADLQFRDFLFLDTETTGLGGAGTLAFMVGVGFFEESAFVVRQYFLRDHGDEQAMLLHLDSLLAERAAVVTFNGRSFDLPLLDGRFLMNRMAADLLDLPHIDLLPPARRLWRRRFQSCALTALERQVLGVQRAEDDVPGWLIPTLYNDYLRSGDGREMARVFYHNRIDILSMVTLAARVVRQFQQPDAGDHPIDLLGLGKWQLDLGMVEEAESTLRLAAVPELPTSLYQEALTRLGYLLKRSDRREEAVAVWQQIACTSFDDVTAHVELAKHYEWYVKDLLQAQLWTERALDLLDGVAEENTQAELEHRLSRLRRKLDEAGDEA